MKQTAVEWLVEQLEFDESISKKTIEPIINKALEMEKEQIMDARMDGINSALKGYTIGNEDYYNETFKSE